MKNLYFIFILIFLSTILNSTIINVPADQTTIQAGITSSVNTDTVLVQPGTYFENINFNGKLITVGSLYLTTQDTSYISSTIIDAHGSGSVVTFNNSEDSTAVLSGFTITNGSAANGGGIYCGQSSPSLLNLTITDNYASYSGGGICFFESYAKLENLTISLNSADPYGGGIYTENSDINLNNIKISSNSASYGAGINSSNTNQNLHNVLISTNSAANWGGGIFCRANSYSDLRNVTITENSGFLGSGIYSENSTYEISNSILWNNSPSEVYLQSGVITITYSDIEDGYTGTGNIDSDPLFTDASNDDYTLHPFSPCIDSGDPMYFDPDLTRSDMGAYYYDQVLNPLPPIADFTADLTEGTLPLTVNFTDQSTNGTGVINRWYWEFGDGSVSSLQDPIHEYQLPGIYTVSLRVTDINDSIDTETKVDYITIDPPLYSGPVWHISTTGDDFLGNGSEQYPFATIQHGINVSSNSDTVLVQPGTYVENINYNGKLITLGSQYLTTQHTSYISSTIIDGNAAGSVVTFESSEDSTAVLTGFTLTNGYVQGGGGINCFNSNPSIKNLIISDNSVSENGGGLCCINSSPKLKYITIVSNSAYYTGGGIYCSLNSTPSLENVTIADNSANDSGGGLQCDGNSAPSLINAILWNNTPQEISINSGSVTATYSNIQGGYTGTGNINFDPLFADPANGDYHLTEGSVCIDSGDPNFPLDPNGTIIEMGAFYYPQPNADFTANITSGQVPLTVQFSDLSIPGNAIIDEWDWNFGDGESAFIQYPENIYFLPGIYTVDLLVRDEDDYIDWIFKDDYITVYSPPYYGSTWHVSTTGCDITGNGSEQYPFATIQHGINASSNSDTVLVQPGTYVENLNYNGKLINVGSLYLTTQDTSYISTTVIDGNAAGSVVTFNTGEDSTTVLSGFTITNGSAANGGGIYCISSSPTMQNITITGNTGVSYGGGIYCENSDFNLNDVIIVGNSANYGSGIFSSNSSSSLEKVTITGNTASNEGGGIFCRLNSNLSLENVTITSNTASNDGGGIYFENSNPILQNVTITGNSGYLGGGIYCFSSSPTMQNITITGNTSPNVGGGIYCWNSNPSIINSILWNNSPQEISIGTGSVTATYSDIQGGWTGTGNVNSDPLFADPGNEDYHLTWANFPVLDATMSPCINTGDPSSPVDPDASIADMGAYYFDITPGAPVITAVTDVPDDQGRNVQVIWNRSPYDPTNIESYSVWRYDDVFRASELSEIYFDPQKIFEKAAEENSITYYWQRDDEILAFITQIPAMGFSQYSIVSPTLKDSSAVSINYSKFKIFAHTEETAVYFPSQPDSGYSVDNIAPDGTEVYIVQNGSNMNISWGKVENGTYLGNSYPEVNGIWYKIYAGDSPDFECNVSNLIDTVTDINYNYPLTGEDKKFFKIVVSDQP